MNWALLYTEVPTFATPSPRHRTAHFKDIPRGCSLSGIDHEEGIGRCMVMDAEGEGEYFYGEQDRLGTGLRVGDVSKD